MQNDFLRNYFSLVNSALYMIAAFPEKRSFTSKFKTFLYNKVWPFVFFSFWVPLMLMTVAKAVQFVNQQKWDEFLEVMHMYFLGTNTLYVIIAVQKTAIYYKTCMDIVRSKFFSIKRVNLRKTKLYVGFLITFVVCYIFKAVACIVYRELSFQVWVPFVNNDEKLSTRVFTVIGLYQILAAICLFIVNAILSPFVIVLTSAVVEEIHYIIEGLDRVVYRSKETKPTSSSGMQLSDVERKLLKRKYRNIVETDTSATCTTEEQSRCFIRNIVSHHLIVKSLIQNVTKIHKYVFLTQFVFTISHSCFLAFNVYYTKNHTKILVKYSPYLLLSYYLLYIFCHNGQRLSDACERLFYAFCW